jgi:hypothetical protein
MRQIADLLRQLGEVTRNDQTRAAARVAAHSVLRGVVLASIGGVEP